MTSSTESTNDYDYTLYTETIGRYFGQPINIGVLSHDDQKTYCARRVESGLVAALEEGAHQIGLLLGRCEEVLLLEGRPPGHSALDNLIGRWRDEPDVWRKEMFARDLYRQGRELDNGEWRPRTDADEARHLKEWTAWLAQYARPSAKALREFAMWTRRGVALGEPEEETSDEDSDSEETPVEDQLE